MHNENAFRTHEAYIQYHLKHLFFFLGGIESLGFHISASHCGLSWLRSSPLFTVPVFYRKLIFPMSWLCSACSSAWLLVVIRTDSELSNAITLVCAVVCRWNSSKLWSSMSHRLSSKGWCCLAESHQRNPQSHQRNHQSHLHPTHWGDAASALLFSYL